MEISNNGPIFNSIQFEMKTRSSATAEKQRVNCPCGGG